MQEKIKDTNNTVKQHYVPRFYMKNFSTIKGVGKNEKVLIGFYQFNTNLLRMNIQTKSICYENYFYGEDGKIEKDFSYKESKWAEVIKNIIKSNEAGIDEYSKNLIKHFAVFQYCRTLAQYKYSKDMFSEILQNYAKNTTSNIKEEQIKEIVNKKIDTEISTAHIIKECDNLVECINDLDVSVIRFNTKNKLITSDMPIIRINPFCDSKAGFADVGVMIFFPISPEVLVVIYDGKIYKNCIPYRVISDEKEVINLNKYQVISSEERILSKSKEQLEEIMNDDKLILKRKGYRDNKKVNFSFDGKETFIAAHSRKIHYDFELSFCKLPKYLKKIPIECREVYQRKYTREGRINLLIGAYRMPELIRQDMKSQEINISKIKNGYVQMQRFMDDYWNIPLEERSISPEFMNKLKTVPYKKHIFVKDKDIIKKQ